MRARQTSSAPSRFVFVDQGIGLKNQKIAFKITNLTNWIGFGIGLRTNLSKIQYAFNCNDLIMKIIQPNMEVICFLQTLSSGLIAILQITFKIQVLLFRRMILLRSRYSLISCCLRIVKLQRLTS